MTIKITSSNLPTQVTTESGNGSQSRMTSTLRSTGKTAPQPISR